VIPLYDRNRRRHFPFITLWLIAVNVLVFFYELSIMQSGGEEALGRFVEEHGLRPACASAYISGKSEIIIETKTPGVFGFFQTSTESIPLSFGSCLLPFVTSLFLHGGWLHVLGNMWFLWVFGDNVEDRLGPVRFLLFYLVGGIFASIVHAVVTLHFGSEAAGLVPTIGASGSVSAVLGAYFVAFPRARIVTLLPIFFFFYLIELPAALFLLIWFVCQQVLPVVGNMAVSEAGGIAFWAHIGGFAVGIVVMSLVPPRTTVHVHSHYVRSHHRL
jgi:membrane associated rhomboid family serine protease